MDQNRQNAQKRLYLDAFSTNVRYSFISYYHKYFKVRNPARKSVYIIAKGWTKFTKRDKASMLLQRTGPNTFVSPNNFIHYPLTPDFVVFTKIAHPKNYIKRQSVYIVPKNWTIFYETRQSVLDAPIYTFFFTKYQNITKTCLFLRPARQSVYIIPKKWTKTDKMRKSVYIIPKKWTKRIFSFFWVSQILQKTTKRLYCSKELDQNYKTR